MKWAGGGKGEEEVKIIGGGASSRSEYPALLLGGGATGWAGRPWCCNRRGMASLSWPLGLGLVCAAETRLAEGNWGNEKSRGVEEEPALFVAEDDDDDEGEEASSMMSVGMENARPRSGGDSRCCA